VAAPALRAEFYGCKLECSWQTKLSHMSPQPRNCRRGLGSHARVCKEAKKERHLPCVIGWGGDNVIACGLAALTLIFTVRCISLGPGHRLGDSRLHTPIVVVMILLFSPMMHSSPCICSAHELVLDSQSSKASAWSTTTVSTQVRRRNRSPGELRNGAHSEMRVAALPAVLSRYGRTGFDAVYR
jgi:hypothetical protein